MYCKKCGCEIKEEWKYCPNCQANLQNGNIETSKEVITEQIKKEKQNALICLIIFLINIVAFFTIERYRGLFFLLALISIVTGYIKFPNSKIIKVFFWLFLTGVILYILLIIILLITCLNMVSNCDASGITGIG